MLDNTLKFLFTLLVTRTYFANPFKCILTEILPPLLALYIQSKHNTNILQYTAH